MKYQKAQNVLPSELVKLIQEYVDGDYLYIPRKNQNKKLWGSVSGSRLEINQRNTEIFNQYQQGVSITELMKQYYLSDSSIRRIIREQRKSIR